MSKHPKPGGGNPHPQPNNHGTSEQKRSITGDLHVRGEILFEPGPEEKLARKATETKQDTKDSEKKWLERATLIIVTIYAALTALQSCYTVKSVNIAKESLESVQRAFIFPYVVTTPNFQPGTKELMNYIIETNLENSGATPAMSASAHGNSSYTKALPKDFDYADVWDEGIPHINLPAFIAPKAHVSGSGPITLFPKQITDIADGKMHFYIWGWLRYRDIFPHTPEHFIRYGYEVRVIKNVLEDGTPGYQIGMIYLPVTCTDEECGKWKPPQQ